MDNGKFDQVWKLMFKYAFAVDPCVQKEDMSCIICKKLMIDACQSVCGCQFCYKCISDYLSAGSTYCPGGKDECNEEHLKVDRDIIRNIRVNNKISKLRVVCPNGRCRSSIELSQMSEHLDRCNDSPLTCPFSDIGCSKDGLGEDSMLNHLQDYTITHTQLLSKSIQNLKKDLDTSQREIASLKEEHNKKDVQIQVLTNKLDNQTNTIAEMKEDSRETLYILDNQNKEIKSIKEQFISEKNKVMRLEEQWEGAKLEMDSKLTAIIEAVKKKQVEEENADRRKSAILLEGDSNIINMINDVRDHANEVWRRNKSLSTTVDQLCSDVNEVKIKYEKEILLLNSLRENMITFKKKLDEDEIKMKKWIKCNNLFPKVEADFIWKITEMSWKVERMKETVRDICSESFYSNGYRLCLRLWINEDNLLLCCVLLQGEQDDHVQWPLTLTVTITILDQENFLPYETHSFNFDSHGNEDAFQRPNEDQRNDYIGVYPFALYSEIINKRTVIVDDTMVVSCLLNDS